MFWKKKKKRKQPSVDLLRCCIAIRSYPLTRGKCAGTNSVGSVRNQCSSNSLVKVPPLSRWPAPKVLSRGRHSPSTSTRFQAWLVLLLAVKTVSGSWSCALLMPCITMHGMLAWLKREAGAVNDRLRGTGWLGWIAEGGWGDRGVVVASFLLFIFFMSVLQTNYYNSVASYVYQVCYECCQKMIISVVLFFYRVRYITAYKYICTYMMNDAMPDDGTHVQGANRHKHVNPSPNM